ncbi:hypothetical protein NC651_007022 [Populus alba x Populus x berolinensis]|nr:hypothetical protein NC651_007022 [Populus alba x Populus x berolinensis]
MEFSGPARKNPYSRTEIRARSSSCREEASTKDWKTKLQMTPRLTWSLAKTIMMFRADHSSQRVTLVLVFQGTRVVPSEAL